MTVERPVLRYFGGKWMLAPWIISHLPPHRIYVEPFGGAASVLMRKPRSYAEVYNDLDGEVVNVFRVLQNESSALKLGRLLELTPFARDEFEAAYESTTDSIERARRAIIRAFMGFGADANNMDRKTGFRSNSNSSGTAPARDWVNYATVIPEFTARLSGVVIENRDAIEVMKAHDSPETLHFVDPPYPHAVRGDKHRYAVEMTNEQHEALVEALRSLKGMVVLCGYENTIYWWLGWKTLKRETHADGARDRTEVLWLNEAAWSRQSQASFEL